MPRGDLSPVDDPADPRVREFVALKDADLRARSRQPGWSDPDGGEHGRFIAEGELVVDRLLASRFRPRSVLVAASKVERMGPLLDRVPAGVPILAASQPIMDRIVGFHIHRGILASADRGPPLPPDRALRGARAVLALEALANHDNVGGIFRSAAALGADAILLSPDCCDPLYRKAIRVSMGHALHVPFAVLHDFPAALATLRTSGFGVIGLTPGPGSLPLDAVPPAERFILVVGAEGDGLRPPTMAACTTLARIPMRPGVDSLNVAVAASIALHRLGMSPGRHVQPLARSDVE